MDVTLGIISFLAGALGGLSIFLIGNRYLFTLLADIEDLKQRFIRDQKTRAVQTRHDRTKADDAALLELMEKREVKPPPSPLAKFGLQK